MVEDIVQMDGSPEQEETGAFTIRDFRPTPFSSTTWEVVGERIPNLGFLTMEIDVLPSEMTTPDPMFPDFGGGVCGLVEKVVHASAKDEEKRPEIDGEYLEKVRLEALEEGKALGREEAKGEADNEIAEMKKIYAERLEALQQNVAQELQSIAAKTEKNALDLALAIARKILISAADAKPEYIIDVIRSALSCTGNPVKIKVSPQDFEFLQVIGLPPELSTQETGVEYVADDTITSGCVMETDFGEVDLQLEHMWQQIKESLFEVAK